MKFFKITISIILLTTGLISKAQTGDLFSDLRIRASSTWSDNLSSTSHAPTLKSGQYFTLSGMLDHMRQLDRDWLLIMEAEALFENVPKFSALNSISGVGRIKVQRKFGLGAFAPVLEFNTAATATSFQENPRSGLQLEAGAKLSKRFSNTLQFGGGINWEDYDAKHRTFDVRTHRVFLEGVWDLTQRWRLSAGASRIWGQFVANADGSIWPLAIGGQLGPEIFQHYNTLAWEVSDTFGSGWVAYRNRESTVDQWWVELSPAITDQTSISLRYEFNRAINAIGIRYDSAFWTLGLNHQF